MNEDKKIDYMINILIEMNGRVKNIQEKVNNVQKIKKFKPATYRVNYDKTGKPEVTKEVAE